MTGTTTRVFVVWDSQIGGVADALGALHDRPPAGFEVDYLGGDGAEHSGAVWTDQVQLRIEGAHGTLVLVDLPNANMGFEFGYALGLGKRAALVCVQATLPEWLQRAPFASQLVTTVPNPDGEPLILKTLRSTVERAGRPAPDGWLATPRGTATGTDTLLLCPSEALREEICLVYPGWKLLPDSGWSLPELAAKMARFHRVWLSQNVREPHRRPPAAGLHRPSPL